MLIGTQEAAIVHTATVVLDVALIAVASAVGLSLLALGTLAAVKIYRRRAARALLAATALPVPAAARLALPAPPLAIEAAPRPGVTVTLSARDYVREDAR